MSKIEGCVSFSLFELQSVTKLTNYCFTYIRESGWNALHFIGCGWHDNRQWTEQNWTKSVTLSTCEDFHSNHDTDFILIFATRFFHSFMTSVTFTMYFTWKILFLISVFLLIHIRFWCLIYFNLFDQFFLFSIFSIYFDWLCYILS